MAYLLVNNRILKETEINLTPFLLTTPIVHKHSIWYGFGGIPLFEENVQIIVEELKAFGHEVPDMMMNRRELFRLLKRMLNKNRFYRTGLITFQFFIAKRKTDYLVTGEAFEEFNFQMNTQGLLINISELKLLSHSVQANSRFARATFWELVKAEFKNNTNPAAIILNEKDIISEGIAANLFMVKENILYTPSAETGCYTDVIRPVIILLAKEMKLKVAETADFRIDDLCRMDEVFFASEVKGIEWVLGFEDRRYVHEYTEKIRAAINGFLEKKVEKQK